MALSYMVLVGSRKAFAVASNHFHFPWNTGHVVSWALGQGPYCHQSGAQSWFSYFLVVFLQRHSITFLSISSLNLPSDGIIPACRFVRIK